jgi:hypothetical protein
MKILVVDCDAAITLDKLSSREYQLIDDEVLLRRP